MELQTVCILKGLLSEVRRLEKKLRLLLKTSNSAEPQKSTDSVEKKIVNQKKPNKKNDAKIKINSKPVKKVPKNKEWRKKEIHINIPSPKVDSPKDSPKINPSPEEIPKSPEIIKKKEEKEMESNSVPISEKHEKSDQEKENSNKILAEKYKEDGNRHYASKDFDSAHIAYQNAFVLCPDDARNAGNLVNCFVKKEEFKEAIQLSIEILSNETLTERTDKLLSGMVRQTLYCAKKLKRKDLVKSYLNLAQELMNKEEYEKLLTKYDQRSHSKSKKRK